MLSKIRGERWHIGSCPPGMEGKGAVQEHTALGSVHSSVEIIENIQLMRQHEGTDSNITVCNRYIG